MRSFRKIIYITAFLALILCLLGALIAWQTELVAGLYTALAALAIIYILGLVSIIIAPPEGMPLWKKTLGMVFLTALLLFFGFLFLSLFNYLLPHI